MNKYLKAAFDTYQKLFPLFRDYSNYWQVGHVLDTLFDYWFTATYPPISSEALDLIVRKYLDRRSLPWEQGEGKNPWWYDDYCWWGIACLRAEQNPPYVYRYVPLFYGITDLNWQPAYRHAPNVWANADQQAFAEYEPMFPNGVWNWIYAMKEIKGLPYTPSVPGKQDGLRALQNTVTNALYWVLMARLYTARGDAHFKTEADNEHGFLKTWFNYAKKDSPIPTSLLYYYDESDRNKVLVRERVGVYKNGSYTPRYAEHHNLAWTGDQGLILGGLVAHMEVVGSSSGKVYEELLDLAKAITRGVLDRLQGEKGNLLPWSPYLDPDNPKSDHGAPGGDYNDYSTGIGVYMRYLLDAFDRNADLRKYVLNIGYRSFVERNGDYVIQHQDDRDRQGIPILNYANDLESLLVAFKMTATAEELEQRVQG